jgi:hypothetical protein
MYSVWSVRQLCKSSNNIETTEQSIILYNVSVDKKGISDATGSYNDVVLVLDLRIDSSRTNSHYALDEMNVRNNLKYYVFVWTSRLNFASIEKFRGCNNILLLFIERVY